jgi:hypothetical protein
MSGPGRKWGDEYRGTLTLAQRVRILEERMREVEALNRALEERIAVVLAVVDSATKRQGVAVI